MNLITPIRRPFERDNIPWDISADNSDWLCANYTASKMPVWPSVVAAGWPRVWFEQPGAKINEPHNLAHFSDAHMAMTLREYLSPKILASFHKKNLIVGVTVKMERRHRTVCIDLDDPARNPDAFAKIPADERTAIFERSRDFCRRTVEWFRAAGAYVETSMSGNGWHIFFRATTIEARYAIGKFGHVYTDNQWIHMTGHTAEPWQGYLPELQARFDSWLTSGIERDNIRVSGQDDSAPPADVTETFGRKLDMSDEDVVAKLVTAKRDRDDYEAGPCTNWSDTAFHLLCAIDKITGDPDQARRVLFGSPRLVHSGEDASGRNRWDKVERTFNDMIRKARVSNDPVLAERERMNPAGLADHGKAVAARVASTWANRKQFKQRPLKQRW